MSATKRLPTFEVDKTGLSKLLARRGKQFIAVELVQNCWDEDTTRVDVTLEPLDDGRYKIVVEDDNPEGFKDLRHAYTLFAESEKKADVKKRGRFNLGEKLVIAVCDESFITTTKGTIGFNDKGRVHLPKKRKRGSQFVGTLQMTREEADRVQTLVFSLIPPAGIETTYNLERVPTREPAKTFETSLRTELADDDGRLRPTVRKTEVEVYEPLEGEKAMLYEMGIPVVETGDRWHVNVQQKVPLNTDRDNVPPYFMRDVRAAVLNETHDLLAGEDSKAAWITDAIQDERIDADALKSVIGGRFGDKAVINDPTDREANKIAASEGYTVVPGGALPKKAWEQIKSEGILQPAGQVTPSPNPHEDADNLKVVDPSHYTAGLERGVAFAKEMGRVLMDAAVEVRVVNDPQWGFSATYGPRKHGREGLLTLNVGSLGYRFFDEGASERLIDLYIHEFGHHYESDHLDRKYLNALTKLGARLALAVSEARIDLRRDYSTEPVPEEVAA